MTEVARGLRHTACGGARRGDSAARDNADSVVVHHKDYSATTKEASDKLHLASLSLHIPYRFEGLQRPRKLQLKE